MKDKNFILNFTGERMINHEKSDIFLSHQKRYAFASQFCRGKKVLDIACGSGYGSNIVSMVASDVVGVDIDSDTIKFCLEKYKKENLKFKIFSGLFLDVSLIGKFDIVISFETIEHIKEYDLFLQNLHKYLSREGILILSTPNNFRHNHPPENKFHTQEFDLEEIVDLLKINGFSEVDTYGQCFTNIRKGDKLNPRKDLKFYLAKSIKKFYKLLDKFGIISRIDHLNIYKAIGSLQRSYTRDFEVKPIDINSKFHNPETSVIICKKRTEEA